MKEEVHTVHSLVADGDVVEDQSVDQPLLHPPQQVGLVIHHGGGGHVDILEIFSSEIFSSEILPLEIFSSEI